MSEQGDELGSQPEPDPVDPDAHLAWVPMTTWIMAGLGAASVLLDLLMTGFFGVVMIFVILAQDSSAPPGSGPPPGAIGVMVGLFFGAFVVRALALVPMGVGAWGAECLRRGGPRMWVLTGGLALLLASGLQLCSGFASGMAYGCVPFSMLSAVCLFIASIFTFVAYSQAHFPELDDGLRRP